MNDLPKTVWGLFHYTYPGTGSLIGLFYTKHSAEISMNGYSDDKNITGYFNIHELEIEE